MTRCDWCGRKFSTWFDGSYIGNLIVSGKFCSIRCVKEYTAYVEKEVVKNDKKG